MILASTVVAEVVDALRDIPDLVDALHEDENIQAFPPPGADYRDWREAVAEMLPDEMLVVYEGVGPVSFGSGITFGHQVAILFRAQTVEAMQDRIGLLCNAVRTSTGLSLIQDSPGAPELELVTLPACARRYDTNSTEYWAATMVLAETFG